ncbi:MAG TPA: putative porin [bacterium]|nr:putative porin [bacterium]
MRFRWLFGGLSLLFVVAASGFSSLCAQTSDSTQNLEKSLGLRFYGDVRFRFTYLVQGQDYAPTGDFSTPLWIDHRLNYRIRARLGAEKNFSDEAKVGLCFITAGNGDPTDPYWTLSGGATFLNVGLDQAYITLSPKYLDHVVTLSVGKIANPLTYTPITWSEDVMPEGIGLTVDPSQSTHFKVLYFRLQDNGPATIEGAGADPFMADIQAQQQVDLGDAKVSLTAGYQYVSNVAAFETGDAGVSSYLSNPTNPPGAPLSITAKGMVGDATNGYQIPEMHVVEGILNISHTIGEEKIPVFWTLHSALNLSSYTINSATNPNVATNNPTLRDYNHLAFYAGLQVGKTEHAGEWAGGVEWAYIQPDAVFSAFNDPNPGLGHNNNTWFMGHVEMGIEDGLSLDVAQYVDWRTDYDVFATTPSDIIGTTSRDPMLTTKIDLTAKL